MIPGMNNNSTRTTVTRLGNGVNSGTSVQDSNYRLASDPHNVKKYKTDPAPSAKKLNNEGIRQYLKSKYAWDKK